ncbi:MAG: response regulator transcription factor [Arcobacter sp.]|uniref:response regulator transcription factor n=1 Tax=Arcobacter sp. TaxID=1872629 RepID=UPI003CFC1964
MKILYLEDDIVLSETVEEFLEDEGFVVVSVRDGQKALDTLYYENFDLLLLDVQVPKLNGFSLLKSIREANIQTPAIFITSLNSIDDLSKGYECGADDYIKKPFELKELLFRIKAILKREYKTNEQIIKIDENISFDINTYKLIINDEIYTLNQKETLLLKLLLKNKNSCVTFDMIFESVWTFDETNNYESLRTYIKNLRKYLGKDRIKNIKKQGYMFA